MSPRRPNIDTLSANPQFIDQRLEFFTVRSVSRDHKLRRGIILPREGSGAKKDVHAFFVSEPPNEADRGQMFRGSVFQGRGPRCRRDEVNSIANKTNFVFAHAGLSTAVV